MRRLLLVLICFPLAAGFALGWNGKGHSLIARLAWRELSTDERAKVIAILQKHPHLEEYLKADRPENIAEDEWMFMRASTWSDWVRKDARYHEGTWHYINLPIIAAGQRMNLPPVAKTNVVTQIAASRVRIRAGNQEDRAIYLCWLCHLIGDIHQPLHCCNFYSPEFPQGDRGGNLAMIRIEGRVVQLHSFWDDLLGSSISQSALSRSERAIDEMLVEKEEQIAADIKKHRLPKDWAQEGYRLAKSLVYQDAKLKPVNSDRKPSPDEMPDLPREYAEEAGAAARVCAAKAGRRLAQALREVVAEK